MITTTEKKELLEIIGSKHISKISNFFYKHKIFNRDNEPYSDVFISRVFNGRVYNKKIQKGIWAYVEELTEEREAEKQKKKQLLEKAKTVSHG